MPWIDVEEPFSALPRLVSVQPSQVWPGVLDLDRGWAEIDDSSVDGRVVDLTGCDELSVSDSSFTDLKFSHAEDSGIEVRRSTFTRCDLSGVRFESVRSTKFEGCKFVGADFSAGRLDDVEFRGCTLRYVNLRMSKLSRVSFVDCTLDDVDLFDAPMTDVSFSGSRLEKVNVDRVNASRVDLRDAMELGLSGFTTLDGCLVAEHQLVSLMHALAFATGLGVESDRLE